MREHHRLCSNTFRRGWSHPCRWKVFPSSHGNHRGHTGREHQSRMQCPFGKNMTEPFMKEGSSLVSPVVVCLFQNSNAGVFTKIVADGMTRGPVIRFPSGMRAVEAKEWAEQPDNFASLKKCFDSTSRFAKLQSIKCCVAGRSLYMRFLSQTGDAMGMNMLSKVRHLFAKASTLYRPSFIKSQSQKGL